MSENIKIILVEDEVVTSLFLKMKLEQMGCIVVKILSKGEDAVEAIDKVDACLILMDINLAGSIDGIEAMKLIKEKIDLPFIFISGYSDDSIVEKAWSLGPIGFLTKPLNYMELQNIIQNSLC